MTLYDTMDIIVSCGTIMMGGVSKLYAGPIPGVQ